MLVPVNWLKEYVNINDIDIKELSDKMIMSGSNIEEVVNFAGEIKDVVVGKILSIEKHEAADKLVVTQVDIGDEVLQIVTGATNLTVGDYIPVIKDGGILPNGTQIKKGSLRGVESNGMLCSAKELGFEDKVIPLSQKDGIFILDGEYELGKDITQTLGLNDEVIDFEITPNRPDCLSMVGMAREAAAVFDEKLKYPDTKVKHEEDSISDYISIEIKNSELCKRYIGRVVKNVKIKPSPWWMQRKLMAAGVRPINNIVDITNYVMLEFGQPLHAFDLRNIERNKIIVDTASEGQLFTTLDGAERKLDKNILMINDGQRSVAIAGIMGGLNSEIQDDTQTILIESANFSADNIRSSSKKLGLRTEASSRFEKGIDPDLCLAAVNRVCKLVEDLGAGTVVAGDIDVYPNKEERKTIVIRSERINSLLGMNLSIEKMAAILKRLEMETAIINKNIHVKPLTVRLDLKEEIDFVEEIARIYGYDNLDTALPKGSFKGGKTYEQQLEDLAKDVLIALGMNEIQTYSFVSPRGIDKINYPQSSLKRNFVKIINPLGEENSVMRTSLIPNLMEVMERNFTRNNEETLAFELGRIFLPYPETCDNLPLEPKNLVLGAYGPGQDFYSLKGIVETLLFKFGMKDLQFIPEEKHTTFHPGRCANIIYNDILLGVIGEISPDVMENYDINTKVYVCDIDFEIVMNNANIEKYYKPLPKYPAITRDIALLVKEEIYVKQIEDIIKQVGGSIIENIELFDIYRGKQVKENHKSVAYSIRYRDSKKTLTDDEVNQVYNKILDELKVKLEAILRD